MRITFSRDDWTINSVQNREGRINPKPQYQRTEVWTPKKKQLLIDSILRGYDLPKFYLRSSDDQYEHEIVDGQQRLRAIWEFLNNKYPLGEASNNIPDFGDLVGKKWSQLSSSERDQIGEFELSIALVEEASDLEIRQLFLRLQEGISLNPAEKRNAMPGNMRDFIAKLAEHNIFEFTHLSEARFKYQDLAAIVTCLEVAGRPTDVKSASLTSMYKEKQDFNMGGSIARKVKRTLNYMARVLEDRRLAMNIKWGFVDLYLLISKMDESYVINEREADFANFYIKFETERRGVSDPRDLISSDKDLWKIDLYDYIQVFKNQGGAEESIQKRHEVYKKRFLRDIQNLIPKDPRRAFTDDERYIIWYRSNGKCQNSNCSNKEISINQMHADHIIPHSRGGETTLENGRALCRQCNTSRGGCIISFSTHMLGNLIYEFV